MSTTKVYDLEGIQLFEVRENDYYRSPCYYLMIITDDLVGIECAIADMQRYNLYKLHFEHSHDSECESKPKEEPKPKPKLWDF